MLKVLLETFYILTTPGKHILIWLSLYLVSDPAFIELYKVLNGINDIKTAPMLKDENGALHIMQLSVDSLMQISQRVCFVFQRENTHWNMNDYIK